MAEAVAIGCVILIYCKPVAVVHIDAVLCSKPHETLAVLQDAGHVALGKSIVYAKMFKSDLLLL